MTLLARPGPYDPANPVAPLEAYKDGRKDERKLIDAGVFDHRVIKKDLDDAYERGRLTALSRRRGSFLGVLSFLVLAALLTATAAMVYTYGSFGGAGAAIDRIVSSR
jgi:hypothetical protein